jgi:hypothetical protein
MEVENMKPFDTGNEEGWLKSVYKSVKSSASCCPPGNSCCCPESETELKGKKKGASASMTASNERLDIEWKHFAVGDATCERCNKTGDALKIAVEELRHELASSGVSISFSEMLLDKLRISESNEIRMNGILLEDLLAATVVSTECPSCGTLAGESTCCRATEIGGNQFEDVPVWAIKKAAYMVLGIETQPSEMKN